MELPLAKLLRRVVIIDHDSTYSQFLSRLITGLGHEVIEITDPCASDFSELKVTDLVFLDVIWPRGEGLQALKTIAQQSSNCSIALVWGANEHPKDAEEFAKQLRQLRLIGVLQTPFRLRDIEKILEDI
jgi:DNA-binding NtrC family response regulator